MSPAADDAVNWTLVVAIVSTLIAAVSLLFNFLQWRWNRRPSFGEWEIDVQYRIDLARDRTRFPATFEQQNPVAGDTGILVRFTYRGRHSFTVIGLIYEWTSGPTRGSDRYLERSMMESRGKG